MRLRFGIRFKKDVSSNGVRFDGEAEKQQIVVRDARIDVSVAWRRSWNFAIAGDGRPPRTGTPGLGELAAEFDQRERKGSGQQSLFGRRRGRAAGGKGEPRLGGRAGHFKKLASGCGFTEKTKSHRQSNRWFSCNISVLSSIGIMHWTVNF
jgi:hypothetical protein